MSVGAPGKAKKKSAKPRLLPGLAVKDGLIRHPFDLKFGNLDRAGDFGQKNANVSGGER